MSAVKIVAIVLIVAGILALVYGQFSFTSTHDTKLGPFAVSVDEKQTVNVPVWVGIGAIVVGGLLLFSRKKS
jgi:LPXTG-motif cell wall-anchored protein